ncbi:NAD(P)-dependent dehydrogenase, short-chain alcohol dehydrogenase family [Parafrankia irregularis]|uniref:NAD(P)-dependent dehydrogenase, short-chain alcohol dehydrogenase family n=1 Tax=Parafrankia irregularis TaxID=795642 RepID=A0A0S4QIH3_9ACTN|nr:MULTISPECIES: SDR family oxidoreductase [Parafrankia]MBE3205681.1 SDR family oxidoreductase [Parafrankia sp. CH37]CUU55419.1 NAD(P)-dependent dehydrogenase, short-chain alcohol dehydrogenase family [Parafrankia irregularis]
MLGLEGKITAVIGAASGIGQAIAVAFAKQGAVVACSDVDGDGLKATTAAIEAVGGQTDASIVDVRSSAEVDSWLGRVVAEHGRLDVAVCTPGINIRKPLIEYTDAEYDAVTDVNLRGSFNVLRGAGRIMAPQGSGSMIVISSISSRVVEPGQVIYAGTKAALAQMVRVFAAELGRAGVRVNAIAPGPVETALTEPIRASSAWAGAYAEKVALGRWARPSEIAGPAVFLASDAATYVTGELMFVDGGWVDLDAQFADQDAVATD